MKTISLKRWTEKTIINEARRILESGDLVIYPTETCYGIGADATNKKAVDRLLEYKGMRQGKPISVAVNNLKMADKYVVINQTAKNLYHNFLPGPITVVSKGKHKVDRRLESEIGSLGVRIPNYPLVLKIIKAFGRPITATSANVSAKKTPYSIADIILNLTEKKKQLVDLIIDAGSLKKNPPSTVVDTTLNELKLIRKGSLDFDKLTTSTLITNSPEATTKFAEKFLREQVGKLDKSCLLFALQGQLGSGKTQFCKGLGAALKVKDNITSPTFILCKEYPFKFNKKSGVFYHLDTWRMSSGEELLSIGFKQMIKRGNVIALEWLEKSKEYLKAQGKNEAVKIYFFEINYAKKQKTRIIKYTNG